MNNQHLPFSWYRREFAAHEDDLLYGRLERLPEGLLPGGASGERA